jgi:hypothetical protein
LTGQPALDLSPSQFLVGGRLALPLGSGPVSACVRRRVRADKAAGS